MIVVFVCVFSGRIASFGIPLELLPTVVPSGTILGSVNEHVQQTDLHVRAVHGV
jgi:sugar (pentulose or hexulose) kinase